MTAAGEWTMPVVVAELPDDGAHFEIAPDEPTRAMLAERAGVLRISDLVARLRVAREAEGAVVEGSMQATVRQTCGVTLEPFDNKIDEAISLRFVSPELMPTALAVDTDWGADDPPDPLVDGRIDLAALVSEFLALAIDPYPRKPGAVFEAPQDDTRPESPFAALAKLKGSDGGESS
jgi:uncharacterized metal-binding protein YceD (DUF177 family)